MVGGRLLAVADQFRSQRGCRCCTGNHRRPKVIAAGRQWSATSRTLSATDGRPVADRWATSHHVFLTVIGRLSVADRRRPVVRLIAYWLPTNRRPGNDHSQTDRLAVGERSPTNRRSVVRFIANWSPTKTKITLVVADRRKS